ncbi:MAG: DNA mismatch repair protein MutS [Polyangiaceae bacterium]|nr:DNA mismatch repair protein MutS [Polyangiaceae bacterium]
MSARDTPLMEQWSRLKRAHPEAYLFFRLGDFYELFEQDAIEVARLLDLTLTSRNKGKPDEVPMCGVPVVSVHLHVAKLLERGHRVAIAEQMADPAKTRGIVPREVVRVLTPGTVTDPEHVAPSQNGWLGALELSERGAGLAFLDVSTSELCAAAVDDAASWLGDLARAAPRELLVSVDEGLARADPAALARLRGLVAGVARSCAIRADEALSDAEAELALGPALRADCAVLPPLAVRAAARTLRFARACTPGLELDVRRVGRWESSDVLRLDPAAQAHLELVASLAGEPRTTLLATIDTTVTPAGARLLRRRLLSPLLDVAAIRRRQDEVACFVVHARVREDAREALRGVGDLERFATRASMREITSRELGLLRDGLAAGSATLEVLGSLPEPADRALFGLGGAEVDPVADVRDALTRALVERPAPRVADGPVFREGFDAELDELGALARGGAEQMVAIETRLRERTGIGSLKVRFTRVFGWYVEVTRAQAAKVPAEFRRKQTVATGERYTTVELDELADRLLHAEERQRERELEVLRGLVELAAAAAERVRALSGLLARVDVAMALAEVAHRSDWTRPEVEASERLAIREGRHPVVERLGTQRFVPNDVALDAAGVRFWLVTGPNMAGKSTFLRQTALLVVLAQMGSYVPARSACVGVVDRVLSRVGASDDLARGASTFMVEMRETAEILRAATRRSLVILDEVGRGTSTFDGLAIAWAVAEHLDAVVRCRTLFATHYHELTQPVERSASAENHSVSAREVGDDVVFLHRVVAGAASRSYGIAVAKLAGLPESVLARARALLTEFEGDGSTAGDRVHSGAAAPTPQLSLFGAPPAESAGAREILETLRVVDLDRTSPLDALALLAKLKARL